MGRDADVTGLGHHECLGQTSWLCVLSAACLLPLSEEQMHTGSRVMEPGEGVAFLAPALPSALRNDGQARPLCRRKSSRDGKGLGEVSLMGLGSQESSWTRGN